jgi:pimeloyl-ACP methyl ester carboxylesterase
MLDYLKWRGDLPFTAAPVNELDMLVFSQLAYLRFESVLGTGEAPLADAAALIEAQPRESGNPQLTGLRHTLAQLAAQSARFGTVRLSHCEELFDEAREMQFAAITAALPDGGCVVAFRGTDATIVGWRENFNMSHACPVPAQAQAEQYLLRVATRERGPLYLCGHSKGGNLALYAAARCGAAIRARTQGVYLFDAPGFPAPFTQTAGYQASLPAVRCYVPQTSIIGQLMSVPQGCTVVHSSASGIGQHNVFTWALDGPRLATLPALAGTSRVIKAALDDFMAESTADMRRQFVDGLFAMLSASGARTFAQMGERWTDTAGALLGAARELDPVTRKALFSVAGTLASSGVESAMRWITADRDAHTLPEGGKPADGPSGGAEG